METSVIVWPTQIAKRLWHNLAHTRRVNLAHTGRNLGYIQPTRVAQTGASSGVLGCSWQTCHHAMANRSWPPKCRHHSMAVSGLDEGDGVRLHQSCYFYSEMLRWNVQKTHYLTRNRYLNCSKHLNVHFKYFPSACWTEDMSRKQNLKPKIPKSTCAWKSNAFPPLCPALKTLLHTRLCPFQPRGPIAMTLWRCDLQRGQQLPKLAAEL